VMGLLLGQPIFASAPRTLRGEAAQDLLDVLHEVARLGTV
jgi:hypothetical protein